MVLKMANLEVQKCNQRHYVFVTIGDLQWLKCLSLE